MKKNRNADILFHNTKLIKYLEKNIEIFGMKRVLPINGLDYTEAELDDLNCCQGCGGMYADADVMIVDDVGPICFNCLYNLAFLAFDGLIEKSIQEEKE